MNMTLQEYMELFTVTKLYRGRQRNLSLIDMWDVDEALDMIDRVRRRHPFLIPGPSFAEQAEEILQSSPWHEV